MNQQSELEETIQEIRKATPKQIKDNVEEWRREHRQMLSAENSRSFRNHFNCVGDKLEVKVGK